MLPHFVVRVLGFFVPFCLVACVTPGEPQEEPVAVGMTHTTSAEPQKAYWEPGLTQNLRLGPRVMQACRPDFGDVEGSPRYWYDPTGLVPADRDMLLQIAQCMRSGMLKGHSVLVLSVAEDPARPDRNDLIVAERAARVRRYLIDHGVAPEDVTLGAEDEVDAGVGVIRDGRVRLEIQAK